MRRLAALAAAALLAGCGGGAPDPQVLGSGPAAVTIFRPEGTPKRTVVLFLHGWGAVRPDPYREWIDHLVAEGHVVVYPRYQESAVSAPAEALPNALRGIRTAFDELHPRRVVAVGHSAGGALSADYAAVARAARLPVPAAILLAYPGRAAASLPGRLPELGDQRIPRAVRIVALASRGDATVGTTTAREVVRDAGHGSYVEVTARDATDHLAPVRDSAVVKRVFWDRLDALVR